MSFGFLQAYDVISTQTSSETGGSSFMALLELPPPQAVELLVNEDFRAKIPPPIFLPILPSSTELPSFQYLIRQRVTLVSAGSCSIKPDVVKQEPLDSDSHLNSSMPPASNQNPKSLKRKEKDKKDKFVNEESHSSGDGPLLMNAFEIITLSQGLNLSALFDRRQILRKKKKQSS